MRETIQWTAPSPLWEAAMGRQTAVLRRAELSRPSILRFATDTFMDDLMQMLANDPRRLAQYVALPETWRGVAPPPEALNPAPAFARNIKRLGLVAARQKDKINGLSSAPAQFTRFGNASTDQPLKIYQPAHQRFYLISACLVCERPGLPDKIPNGEREEKVSFIIRRLFPPGKLKINEKLPPLDSSWKEYAFIQTEQGTRWQPAANPNTLLAGEEPQPLFSVNFNEDDGRRRKLFAGVIPAGRREAYMAAASASTSGGGAPETAPPDSRILLMRAQFRDPWKSLLQTAQHAKKALGESASFELPDVNARKNIVKSSREQIQAVSWLVLVDFADFLINNLKRVWDSLKGIAVSPALNSAEAALVKIITNTKLTGTFENDLRAPQSGFLENSAYSANQVRRSLKDALLSIKGTNPKTGKPISEDLEAVGISYDRKIPNQLYHQYPDFLFPLADPVFTLQTVLSSSTNPNPSPTPITPTDFAANDYRGENCVNKIAQFVEAALPAQPQNQRFQPTPLAAQVPMDMREGWFVIRCVYERPLCGTIDPPVLSAPTEPFQIAGFFDPDAPARPIRIALPLDPTPAGLRKFNKNTAFMMSDLLCGQVNRMKGITFGDLIRSVLPFPLHKDLNVPDAGGCKEGGISVGMMCSMSIPIITICALILLMIIVSLLDFIFRWMPFFTVCFPLPGLKSKNE
jgi:hypothetical protein